MHWQRYSMVSKLLNVTACCCFQVRKTENIGIYEKNVDNLSEKKPPGKSKLVQEIYKVNFNVVLKWKMWENASATRWYDYTQSGSCLRVLFIRESS